MKRYVVAAMLAGCSVSTFCNAVAEQSGASLAILGIHVGQSSDDVGRTLQNQASFSKEEEGQQVWRVLHEPGVEYLILGFDHAHKVRYVTALAGPDGPPMVCAPLGDVSNAVKSGQPGNVELRRDGQREDEHLFVIARGTSPDHLSSCSIKKQGGGTEEEEEEERRGTPRHP